jgi:hypothetical protein
VLGETKDIVIVHIRGSAATRDSGGRRSDLPLLYRHHVAEPSASVQ